MDDTTFGMVFLAFLLLFIVVIFLPGRTICCKCHQPKDSCLDCGSKICLKCENICSYCGRIE